MVANFFFTNDGVFNNLCIPWHDSLITKLFGKSVGFFQMKSRLRGVWKQSGDFELMDVNNGFFAVKFDIKDHITKVITRGSWMIFDHYLAVCTWSSDFNLVTTKINQTMVWQRILSLKLVFYDESFLLVMLIIVSTLVKVDLNTFNVEREKSAWVC
ncbi:hypothetical protein NC653_034499 [Populus alba x Populus x berolinensis]|uniref:DUF4283 domain-containing protein n=1 Tax=Populus alba x Populus x berolinensis TaxID=444605 RepID=A0AAD6PW43_9ROSI|nr:hypothetical protein NC653_034499 [Populus alba x Populus x berolinensis]